MTDSKAVAANTNITVHQLSSRPTEAWQEILKTQQVTQIQIQNPSKRVDRNKIRIVCMSDTHSETENIRFEIPDGDILIHAGDFTRCGDPSEVKKFNEWIKSLPHRYKIAIAGNHEETFDNTCSYIDRFCKVDVTADEVKSDLKNCIYLEDSAVILFGIKFYGAPWTPKWGGGAGGFNLARGEDCLSKWNLIPEDTDILITHGPPLGYNDLVRGRQRAGCLELLSTVQKRVKPKYHIFGHVHEGYGMNTDGHTVFINAATCNIYYLPKNPPIVFDYPIPNGFEKQNIHTPWGECCTQS